MVKVKAKGEVEFLGSKLSFSLEITPPAQVKSSIYGDLALDLGDLGYVVFGEVSLGYDGSQPDYQFQGDYLPPGASDDDEPSFRIYFGTAGARVCSLLNSNPLLCFP